MELKVELKQLEEGIVLVKPQGTVELASCDKLREALKEAFAQAKTVVICDMDGIDLIDSAGLGVLVGGTRRAKEAGLRFALLCNQRRHRELLSLTGLHIVFSIYTSLDEARRDVKKEG